MPQDTVTITLPFGADVLNLILLVAGLSVLGALIFVASNRPTKNDRASRLPRFHVRGGLNLLGWFAVPMFFVWLALLVLTIQGLAVLWFDPPTAEDGALAQRVHYLAIVGLMTALAGLTGTPLALIRVWTNERQTKATEEGLITDRINKAVAGLGAEKVVKRHRLNDAGKRVYGKDDNGNPDFSKPVYDETTAPNLEVRIGGIYSLERIAQDSDRDHIQVMEILCAYIRENADGENAPLPDGDPTPQEWQAWGQKGRIHPRLDVDVALKVIERRSPDQKAIETAYSKEGYRLGLERAPLRKLVLTGRDLSKADLHDAQLQGANLWGAKLQGANLGGAKLQGANLRGAELQGANLWRAELQGANLGGAQLQGADLGGAQLQGADLGGAKLQGADLRGAQLQGADLGVAHLQGANLGVAQFDDATDLTAATFQGAAVRSVDFTTIPQIARHLADMFGDASVLLPDGVDRPAHWPDFELDYDKFETEWRKWQADPGGYVPPESPNPGQPENTPP